MKTDGAIRDGHIVYGHCSRDRDTDQARGRVFVRRNSVRSKQSVARAMHGKESRIKPNGRMSRMGAKDINFDVTQSAMDRIRSNQIGRSMPAHFDIQFAIGGY